MENLIAQKKLCISDEKRLRKESIREADKAENIGDIARIAKSNALRRGAEEKLKKLQTLEDDIKAKENALKAIA